MRSDFIANALGLKPPSDMKNFSRVVTDSRKIQPGDLFVAIPGEKFDGHDFVASVIEKGAGGVVIRESFDLASSTPSTAQVFRVKDTLEAYRALGYAWSKTFQIPVIAVAGSVGKTTTKELLAAILRGKYPTVHKTLGSQNGFVGIPMTLLELNSSHGASVIEIGIDDIGAMIQHMPLIEADAAILSAIGPEHLENLKDLETVAYEESIALRETLKRGGKIAINLDDPWTVPLANELDSPLTYTYSLEKEKTPKNPSRFVFGMRSTDGGSLLITAFHKHDFNLKLPLPGEHNARNLVGAVAVALMIGLTPQEIEKGLLTFEGMNGRSEIKARDGHTYVCDYYNANPTSMRAAFLMTAAVSPELPHFACLADMLELGPGEEKYHRDLAPELEAVKWSEVFLFGERMKWLADELGKRGRVPFRHFATKVEMQSTLNSSLKQPSVILIKGSRSMKMEDVFTK